MFRTLSAVICSLLLALPSLAQAAQQVQTADSIADTTVVRQSLLQLLERASKGNALPRDLVSYSARVETEIAVLLRMAEGNELVSYIEQVASDLRWTRTGLYEQRIVGHRAQQSGISISMLSVTPVGWITPTLYGSRFQLRNRSTNDSSTASRRTTGDGADTMPIVHPLAPDRDNWYSYSGGDTESTIHLPDRSIPIAVVRVHPRKDLTKPAVLFDGEISLDVTRGTLVRFRGHFVRAGSKSSWPGSLGTAVAFVEYEQSERDGKYWLPRTQRIELQASSPLFDETRAVIRIASRIVDLKVNDTIIEASVLAKADSTRRNVHRRLTFAPSDSMSSFNNWSLGIGTITDGMHADDFDDLGPDRWRSTGAPRLDIAAFRLSDVVRYNRIEGLYTGLGAKIALRDLAPGYQIRASGGYAWNEETVRGRVSLEKRTPSWKYELRLGRSLDVTNDFRFPMDSGTSLIGGLLGSDPNDYVDRSSAMLFATRFVGKRELLLRAELGYADDRYRSATVTRGVFKKGDFRENRNVDEGGYIRSGVIAEWRPDVSAELMKPGIGARLSYERGDGTLSYQRVELRSVVRKHVGPLIATSRIDAGVVNGGIIPPQQLFELGEQQNLPGYGDKEFAGSRAILARGQLMYISPFLRDPIRISRRLMIAGINPGVSVSVQSGWTDAHSHVARSALQRLTPPLKEALTQSAPSESERLQIDSDNSQLLSRPTEGVRTTVSAGLRFFSGAIFVGWARPVDRSFPWKLTFGGRY